MGQNLQMDIEKTNQDNATTFLNGLFHVFDESETIVIIVSVNSFFI